MVILSLLRINVIFALLMAALTAGIVSGMSLSEATDILVDGMANQSGTALSYILLGIFAVMIGMSGITTRSEERRVGKEVRSRRSTTPKKKSICSCSRE